jgi:hypothetical protein
MLDFEPHYAPNSNRISNVRLSGYNADPLWYNKDVSAYVKVMPDIAFHTKGFLLTRGTENQYVLKHGLDYTFGLKWNKASMVTQTEIYCVLILNNSRIIDEYNNAISLHQDPTLRASYNAIGGPTFRRQDLKPASIFSRVTPFIAHTQWADDLLPYNDFPSSLWAASM